MTFARLTLAASLAPGLALALEDRCPHRRVPLSLGEVKDGRLQCGYHGWTFDGASGACTAIPHLTADERVPARYGARACAARPRRTSATRRSPSGRRTRPSPCTCSSS